MEETAANRVRELREARGWSQSILAQTVGLSRQSVFAIETGRALPAVDIALRLAKALDCPVEGLFGSGTQSEPRAKDSAGVVLMGCAPALGLLADRLNARPGPGRFLWLTRSSSAALESLKRGQTQLAGVHLVDEKTGEANLPDVRRLSSKRALVVITLARWEAGLVIAPGNPKRITKIAQLARKGVRLASREPGSGARRLLDHELRQAGLPATLARDAAVQAAGHDEVARAVALGVADAGIATRDAARKHRLDFVSLAEERYDLVVAQGELTDPRLARLFETMTAAPFRRELSALGYDVAQCGQRVAQICAA
ncbi:MAG TPA: substrate-binding domain-containing protein [Polyangiaceae bacterium]|jgi:molybdate-binding protein/DNA-binding XRE family transcriptional regulator